MIRDAFLLIGLSVFLLAARVVACEDKHPPILKSPQYDAALRDSEGNLAATVTVDPRGMGRLRMEDEPGVDWTRPELETWAWDYREWQWWKGHPWGDSCRPRYYSKVKFEFSSGEANPVRIRYSIDGFDCEQTYVFPAEVDPEAPYWDVTIRIENASGATVEEYAQFFACYTRPNERGEERKAHWFWDESGELVRWDEKGVDHLDGYIVHPYAYFRKQGSIPHCPRGGGKVVGTWKRPVLVSNPTPKGWRSIILLAPRTTAALAQGMSGVAMDYILFPGPEQKTFAPGDSFTAQVRHVLLKSPELPSTQRLEELWEEFEKG